MAEKLKKFEFKKQGRGAKYPWEQWLDGGIWRLEAGKDYSSKTTTMQSGVQNAARAKGMKARTQVEDGGKVLVIQAYVPEEGDTDTNAS